MRKSKNLIEKGSEMNGGSNYMNTKGTILGALRGKVGR